MTKRWEILKTETCFQGFFKIDRHTIQYERFEGGHYEVSRELFERGNAAAVLPYDPVRDEIVLVEQFRPGAIHLEQGPWLMELIAGIVEPDEAPHEVVLREAMEEANCKISDIEPLYRYLASPGGCTEEVSLFCARTDTSDLGGIHGLAEEGEDIKVHVFSRAKAIEMMESGMLNNAMTLIALQWFERHYGALMAKWGFK